MKQSSQLHNSIWLSVILDTFSGNIARNMVSLIRSLPSFLGPSNPPHEQAVIPWIWPFSPRVKWAPVATFYSIWLCTSRSASPELHEFLNKEVLNGAKRAFRPYLHFPPHITLAAYLPVRHPQEQSKRVRQEQFRWFVQTVKVPTFEHDPSLRTFAHANMFLGIWGCFAVISQRKSALCVVGADHQQ